MKLLLQVQGLGDAAVNALKSTPAAAVEEDALRLASAARISPVWELWLVQYRSGVVREDQGGLVVCERHRRNLFCLEQNGCVRREEDARGPIWFTEIRHMPCHVLEQGSIYNKLRHSPDNHVRPSLQRLYICVPYLLPFSSRRITFAGNLNIVILDDFKRYKLEIANHIRRATRSLISVATLVKAVIHSLKFPLTSLTPTAAVEEDALRPGQRGADFACVGVVAEVQYRSGVVREDQGGLVVVDAIGEIVLLEQNGCVRREEDARGPHLVHGNRHELARKLVFGQNHNPHLRHLVYYGNWPRQLVTAQIKGVKIRQSENRRRNRSLQAVIRQAETLAF
nr:hypothetical protein Iba_chr04dCG12290 [Ipomoea batatas]